MTGCIPKKFNTLIITVNDSARCLDANSLVLCLEIDSSFRI